MKQMIMLALLLCSRWCLFGQTTNIASNYKHITIDATTNTTYSHALILLHAMYNGNLIGNNYAVGFITARRGGASSYNRLNVAELNTSSAYQSTTANLVSVDDRANSWKLKTCTYNGTKYLAVDIPYADGQHALGFQFCGWTTSTAENMKFVVYDIHGVPQNQSILSEIADYAPNMQQTSYVSNFNIMGNVGIGTTTPSEKLAVNGNIRAKEIKVETANWPDYVFDDDYQMPSLTETEAFIKKHKHLPGMPDKDQVAEEGISLGEMNRKLLEKVEELTLLLIEERTHRMEADVKLKELGNAVQSLGKLMRKD